MNYKELCKTTFLGATKVVFFIENKSINMALRDFKSAVSDLFFEFIHWMFAFLYLLLFPVTHLIVFKLHFNDIKARKKDAGERKRKKIGKLFRNIEPKENTLHPDRF